MSNFEVIASSGHCGTMWLSKVLNAGTGTRWYHELRREMAGPWTDALLYGIHHERFSRYFSRLEYELDRGNVGDSNSWLPTLLPRIHDIVPIARIIYLTRNPIRQLHSLTTRSPVWSRKHIPELADRYLLSLRNKNLSDYLDRAWAKWSRWERLCLMVAANDFMPGWLRQRGFSVEVYSLEDLTSDVDLLRSLAPNLSVDEAQMWQHRDINRKVPGDRSPEVLWSQWTEEQREGFRRVVIETGVLHAA